MAGQVALLGFLTACFSVCLSDTGLPQPVVEAKFGKVLGKTVTLGVDKFMKEAKSVDVFRSIPYAEAPVGSLRFKPPVAKTWEENTVFDATGKQYKCMQDKFDLIPMTEENSEDCLHLDVYTPNPRPAKALPVMVFIHGGGFALGVGTSLNTSQVPMVAIGNVVVVNINYRLNIFGFFSTGDDTVPGNMGLKDQTLALQWVRDNIAEFGGDPDMVTIYGESAGSMSVTYHVISPMSKGLFHRAIMQSGTLMDVFEPNPNINDLEQSRAFAFGRTLGCNQTNTEELVECLQSFDSETILANQSVNTVNENGESPLVSPFIPNCDGEFIPDDPRARYDDINTINDVDIMLGSLADEGSVFVKMGPPPTGNVCNRTSIDNFLAYMSWTLFKTDIARETTKSMYLTNDHLLHPESDHFPVFSQMVGDIMFLCPTEKTARQLVTAGKENVYLYHITHTPSQSLWNMTGMGATHGEDLQYVFGMHYNEHNFVFYGKLPEDEVRLTNAIITYWSNFAKTGDPNRSGDDNDFVSAYPEWPKYTLLERGYKDISACMNNGNSLKIKECSFINYILPDLESMEEKLKKLESEEDAKSKYACQASSCDGGDP